MNCDFCGNKSDVEFMARLEMYLQGGVWGGKIPEYEKAIRTKATICPVCVAKVLKIRYNCDNGTSDGEV